MGEPGVPLFYGVLLLILLFATLDVVNEHDYTRAAESAILKAHSMGIGSGWIGLVMGH